MGHFDQIILVLAQILIGLIKGRWITFSIFIIPVGQTYDEIKWDSDQALVNTSGLFMDIGLYLLQGAIDDPNYYSGCSKFKHQFLVQVTKCQQLDPIGVTHVPSTVKNQVNFKKDFFSKDFNTKNFMWYKNLKQNSKIFIKIIWNSSKVIGSTVIYLV